MKRYIATLLLSLFAAATMAGTEVYAPTLKNPADSTIGQMPNLTVSWNAIVGSTGVQYEVQLDTSINFNSPKLTDTTLVLLCGYTCHELLMGTKYFWRVRAIDLGVTSDWSSIRTVTIFSHVTPSSPTLTPSAAQKDTIAPQQVLGWSKQDSLFVGKKYISLLTITGVKYYDIQCDTSKQFNSPLLISGTVASTLNTFMISNLKFGTKYYWRVRARHNLSSSNWSATWYFTVAGAIVQTAPVNNAQDQMLDAKLTWKAVKGLLGYEYQLATDTGFINVIAGSEVPGTWTGLATVSANSQYTKFGNKYYWRVRGRHISDTSKWSNRFAFFTIDKVKLTSPSNNSTNITLKPTLKWTKQTGIVKYQLQMDIDQNFSAPLLDVKVADSINQYLVTRKMINSTQYFWRMRAFSDSQMPDTSGWSEVWNFTTLAPTGIGENGLLASSIYPNPASEKVTVKLESQEAVSVQFAVFDLLGRTLIRDQFDLVTGTNTREINISNLSKGIYIIRLTYNGAIINHKLTVDR